jgi:uncharacterized membrane protein
MKLADIIFDLFDRYFYSVLELLALLVGIVIMLIGGLSILGDMLNSSFEIDGFIMSAVLFFIGLVIMLLIKVIRIYENSKKSQ